MTGRWAWWYLQPCGTPAAYRRHLRRQEPVDQRCRDAERLRKQLAREAARGALRA